MSRTVLFRIMTVVLLIAGLGVLFYPAVVNIIYVSEQNKINELYDRQIQNLSQQDIDSIRDDAADYNDRLTNVVYTPPADGATEDEEAVSGNLSYSQLLSVNGDQMGYVIIPKISVNLPIYHYDNDEVLSVGVGHMEYTSLPIGGESTHCVLSGHTGLPYARFFSDLEKMEVGDRFYLKTLDKTLCYEVDQIKVVLPNNTEELQIFEGRDLVTLLTCTPYGQNTHRLLVRGSRILSEDEINAEIPTEPSKEVETTPTNSVAEDTIESKTPSPLKNQADIYNPEVVRNQKSRLSHDVLLRYVAIPTAIAIPLIVIAVMILKRKKNKNHNE